ncbi:hypothetical protein NDU88_008969 [Pleurodeles waltl]|uniref:Uncharacterized protein n=1 Tax=Pleurodeles waltl TaxID=8319 RepID=A0AAV7RZ73_PLEWA|nr:hypothetical protein NDU88_008969 [Pleurodeles waltl]
MPECQNVSLFLMQVCHLESLCNRADEKNEDSKMAGAPSPNRRSGNALVVYIQTNKWEADDDRERKREREREEVSVLEEDGIEENMEATVSTVASDHESEATKHGERQRRGRKPQVSGEADMREGHGAYPGELEENKGGDGI